jgi:HEAT repeat protein
VVEELLRALDKGQRALQMYLPNNPVYRRALEQISEAFAPVWSVMGRLVLDVREHDLLWEETAVATTAARGEGLAWQLHKDGVRRLTLLPGVESEEIIRFLEVLSRARRLPADASDDLLTLLWQQEFVLISYAFVEVLGDGTEFLQESPEREAEPVPEAARNEVAAASRGEPAPAGLVNISDADSTPYFLDDAEIRFIRADLDEEYRRDIRGAAIDALLDIMETVPDAAVRREAVSLLEEILPTQLAMGGFAAVAHLLRELRVVVARVPTLDQELHAAVLSFEERLSRPEILEQLFRVLEDNTVRGDEGDIGSVLRELRPEALPPILAHLGRTLDPAVRRILSSAADDLARSQPGFLAKVLEQGPSESLEPAIDLVARQRLTQLTPLVIGHATNGEPGTRLAAVRALATLGSPSAVDALEAAVLDPERTVRQAAVTALLERGGSGGAQAQLEHLLFDDRDREWERSERRTMFEAYAQLAGPDSLPRLQELLEPKGLFRRSAPAEVRACAIYALARVRTFEARMVVDRFTADKEPVVRSAANAVLRDWRP